MADPETLRVLAAAFDAFNERWRNRYVGPAIAVEDAVILRGRMETAGFRCDTFGRPGSHGWRCDLPATRVYGEITIDHAGGEPAANATAWAWLSGVESEVGRERRPARRTAKRENEALAACRREVDFERGRRDAAVEERDAALGRERIAINRAVACEERLRHEQADLHPQGKTESERRFAALEWE